MRKQKQGAISFTVPANGLPPTQMVRVIVSEDEGEMTIPQILRRSVDIAETMSWHEREDRDEILISVSLVVPEVLDSNGSLVEYGRSDVLWRGNLVTATEYLSGFKPVETEAPDA